MAHGDTPAPFAGGAGQLEPEKPGSVPWGFADAVATFFLAFLLTVLAVSALGVVLPAGVPQEVSTALSGPLTLLILGLTTLGWVGLRYTGAVPLLAGVRRPTGNDVLVGLGIGVGAVLVISAGLGYALGFLLEVLDQDIPTVQQQLRDAARDARTAPILVFSALVVAPVCEELFFRGMVFPAIAKQAGLWGGILLSAALFGFVHLNQAEDALGALVLLVRLVPLGIVFAWLYHWRGTLVVPILVHSVFNAASVAWLLAGME